MARKGNIKAAFEVLAEVQVIDPTYEISAGTWNGLCLNGSLWGFAMEKTVMSACKKAVEMAPDKGYIHDSRGVARALTGDFTGAIKDFQYYIQELKQRRYSQSKLKQRQEWIEKLRAKQNLFNEELLKQLREERGASSSASSLF